MSPDKSHARLQKVHTNVTLVLFSVAEKLRKEDRKIGIGKSPHFQIKKKG